MNTLIGEFATLAGSGGLNNLTNTLISDWIGPAFVLIMAVIAITLALRKQLAGFLSFAAVAVVAAVFIFFGGELFGGKDKKLTKVGGDLSKKIGAVDLQSTTFNPDFLNISDD